MAYAFDPEIAAALQALSSRGSAQPAHVRGDWRSMREAANASFATWAATVRKYPNIDTARFLATASDGTAIELRWYKKVGAKGGSAVVYAHGGGMVAGSLDNYDGVISQLVAGSGVPFLSVQYRLAPEVRGTTPAEDAYAAILWLFGQASILEVDRDRIAVMGDSAGGGVMAGAAIMARDRNVRLARQILIYPMLDDRSVAHNPSLEPFLTLNHDKNFTSWSALLGDQLGAEGVSPVAVPARLKDFTGLASAYIEVGELDLYCDEDVAYAQQLLKAGVSVELHVHPGAPHGFDRLAPHSQLVSRVLADRLRVLKSL